eukprot:scaffold33345_cov123-Isochrysis_galbana.AAC.4
MAAPRETDVRTVRRLSRDVAPSQRDGVAESERLSDSKDSDATSICSPGLSESLDSPWRLRTLVCGSGLS